MAKFYIKYIPPRRGIDMVEYLQDYLQSVNSTVTFQPAFYDNIFTFGVLEGTGDELSRVLRAIEGRSAAVRLSPEEFAGASIHTFKEYSGPEKWESSKVYSLDTYVVPTSLDIFPEYISFKCTTSGTSGTTEPIWPTEMNMTVSDNTVTWTRLDSTERYIPPEQRPNWVNWMAQLGITVDEANKLDYAKYYKAHLLKEITKKRFCDDNDSIADLSKAVMALVVHYPLLTPEQKTLVDNQVAIIKQIYDPEASISGLTELTSRLSSVLSDYYAAKLQIAAATSLEEINSIIYE